MAQEKIIKQHKFFSNVQLQRLKDLESQQITSVFYHYWINAAIKDEPPLEMLQHIELKFIDNTSLCFSASELCDSIQPHFADVTKEKEQLKKKFGENISIKSVEVSRAPLWSRVLGYPVAEILLDKNSNNRYYSDKILIAFLPVHILVKITDAGLHVEEITDHLN